MKRREFSDKVRLAAFQRAAGKCEKCDARLFVGKFHYDHRIADGLDGEATLRNCQVLCVACHGAKTADDLTAIAQAKRRLAKHIGIKRPTRWPKPPSGIRIQLGQATLYQTGEVRMQ